jgi:hypothetical protein
MALSISQIVAASYPAVLNEARKPANQWAETPLVKEMERQGMIQRKSLGPTIECTLDVVANAGADFLATDLTAMSLSKTDVLSAASYSVAELSVPVVWSKGDDAKNPTENQKVALVKNLLSNGIDTHDTTLEQGIFASSTDGFLGCQTIIPDSGQGTVGGIDASTETMWRNTSATYAADGSDIEAALTAAYNAVAKGSGSSLVPSLLFSGADPHALYEASLTTRQRYASTEEITGGVKKLAFKTAAYIFSQHGGSRIYGANKKSFSLIVSKEYFRDKGPEQELNDKNGTRVFIYSALQLVTNNKSRLFVLTVV